MKRGWLLVLVLVLGVIPTPGGASVTLPVPVRITAPTPDAFSLFGVRVAVDGDTAVVTPHRREWIAVYRQAAIGRWGLEEVLSVPSSIAGEPRPVAIEGGIIVVGVNEDGSGRGGVYVFERPSGSWIRTAVLTPGDGEPWVLGWSGVDVDDETGMIAIGNPFSYYGPNLQGDVRVFRRHYSGSWTPEATLESSNGSRRFGETVAVDDGVIVVGAPNDGSESGAAFVFERSFGRWEEQAALTSPIWPEFPRSVAIDSGTIAAGAQRYRGREVDAGVIVFSSRLGHWRLDAILTVDPLNSSFFGEQVAIDGDAIVGGALRGFYEPVYPPYPVHEAFHNPGAAYVWTRTAGTWELQMKINTPTPWDKYTWFGGSVAISNGSVWVGAYGEDELTHEAAGAAYVFPRLDPAPV